MDHVEFAELIVNALNSKEDWFIKFKAVHGYHPDVILQRPGTVKVIVATARTGAALHDQTAWALTPSIEIGIIKKLSQREILTGLEDNAEVNPLMKLSDQIENFLMSKEFQLENFLFTDIPEHPTFIKNHLTHNRQFTRVFRANFETYQVPC